MTLDSLLAGLCVGGGDADCARSWARLSSNERALLDMELATAAPRFIGNLVSTFTFIVYERRALLGKASFSYNSRFGFGADAGGAWSPDPLFDECNVANSSALCPLLRRLHLDRCADVAEVPDSELGHAHDMKRCWTKLLNP